MKSLATAVVIGILGLVATSNPLSAQFMWLGGGGTFPVSDYGSYANTGFLPRNLTEAVKPHRYA